LSGTTPTLTLANTTDEDSQLDNAVNTSVGRETKIVFKGDRSGGETNILASLVVGHEGTADDQKGQMQFFVNNGSQSDTALSNVMNIMDTGFVGIGTTAPDQPLEISHADTTAITGANIASNAVVGLHIDHTADTDAAGSVIKLSSNTDACQSAIAHIQVDDNDADLAFYTDKSGTLTEAMRIDNNQYIGIGTTSPGTALEINGSLGSDYSPLLVRGAHDGSTNIGICVTEVQDNVGRILFNVGAQGTNPTGTGSAYTMASIQGKVVNSGGTLKGAILFTTNAGDNLGTAMYINEDQEVGVNNTNPGYRLDVFEDRADYAALLRNDGNNANRKGLLIVCGADSPSSAGDCAYIDFQDGDATAAGGIRQSTNVDLPEFYEASDARIKEDIADTKVNALVAINSLKLREFKKKDQSFKRKIGLVAQEVLETMPELVGKTSIPTEYEDCFDSGEEEMYTIGTGDLTYYYLKAIQELSAKVEALENA
jgi:hypothetical protein